MIEKEKQDHRIYAKRMKKKGKEEEVQAFDPEGISFDMIDEEKEYLTVGISTLASLLGQHPHEHSQPSL